MNVYKDYYTLHTGASVIKTETSTNLLYINIYTYRQLDNMTISNTTRLYLGCIIPSHDILNMFIWDGVFPVE